VTRRWQRSARGSRRIRAADTARSSGLPPTPFAGYGTVASQAPAPAPAWLGTTSRDATVDLSTLNGPANGTTPAPGAVLTGTRENCTRCGTRLAAEAHFCSTCGQARS
jgi:hypothetical protein